MIITGAKTTISGEAGLAMSVELILAGIVALLLLVYLVYSLLYPERF